MNQPLRFNPEMIAYWFFRLNGCLMLSDFVVHPDFRARSQRTDVDILAVRFPYRSELITSGNPMLDHDVFSPKGRIEIVFAEVKHDTCRLNGPWTEPKDENMQRVLYAIGAFPERRVPDVAQALYREGQYRDELFLVRLFAIGTRRNPELMPGVVQLTWDEILQFIHDRFYTYRDQKAHHPQWNITGSKLYQLVRRYEKEDFIAIVKEGMDSWVASKK